MSRPELPAVGSTILREFRLERAAEGSDSNALPRSTLSTGDEVPLGGGYHQVLEHDADAIDFERAADGLPLLVVHGAEPLPVGRVENVALEDGVLRGDPVISEATEYTRSVLALVLDGTIRDLSIGARVDAPPVFEEREGQPDLMRIPRWTPMEVSLAAVGVDGGAGIARAFNQENRTMPEQTTPAPAGPRPVEADPETIRRSALAQARDLFVEGYPDHATRAGELLARASMPGQTTTPEAFGAELMELASADGETIHRAGRFEPGQDHIEKTMIGLERAMCVRTSNPIGDLVTRADGRQELMAPDRDEPWANPFSGLDLPGLAREWLKAHGIDPAGMSKSTLIERVMDPEHRPVVHMVRRAVDGTAQNETGTFTHILENVLNKSLFRGFEEHPSTWQVWCQRGSQPDFKAFTRPGLSHYGDLSVVDENGEYLEVPMVDKKEGSALVKHGGRFSITWEALIGDDLSAFSDIGPAMGRSGARLVDSLPYALIVANPNMTEDGFPLFDNTNRTGDQANLGTAALAEGAINAMRVSMVRKVDQNSVKIMPQLTYLIAPPELTETGEKLLRGSSIPTGAGAQEHNTVQGRYTWIESAWLTDGTDWYGAANTGTVEMHFLDGNERPTLRRESGFKRDVEWFRVRQVAVALAVDWRGMYKNVVAGG